MAQRGKQTLHEAYRLLQHGIVSKSWNIGVFDLYEMKQKKMLEPA